MSENNDTTSSGEEQQDKPTIEEIEDQTPEERKKMSFGGDSEDIIDDCIIHENIERLQLEVYIPNSSDEIIDKLDTYIFRRQRLFPAKIIVVESFV